MTTPAGLPRLAVVLSHPTQYYSPWFRWLRQHTPLSFRVFYLWDFGVVAQQDPQFERTIRWDVDLLSGYDHEFVPNLARDPGTHHFKGLYNPQLGARLGAWGPEAVLLFGYGWGTHLRAILWARRRGLPLLLRGDSHLLGRSRPTFIKRMLLQVLFRQFAAALPVGQANHDYFREFGLPDSRLFFAPHSVDTSRFDPEDPATIDGARELRDSLGLAGKRVLLFAGKFHERKQPVPLLRAFLRHAGPDDALVLVGDGPERARLESLAAGGRSAVRILPFVNQSKIPSHYAMADIFALPSRGVYETWGLAVNEAMHLGRPCLVSDRVGCQLDLVQPGSTGWVFAVAEPDGLDRAVASALRTVPAELHRLGANARKRAAGYTYAETSAGLMNALLSLTPTRLS